MDFQIYEDVALTKPVEDLNLGKLKAGESKQFTYYIANASVYPYEELQFHVEHKEVKILHAPVELNANSNSKIILEWNPSVSVKRGLKTTLKIEGFQVIS